MAFSGKTKKNMELDAEEKIAPEICKNGDKT